VKVLVASVVTVLVINLDCWLGKAGVISAEFSTVEEAIVDLVAIAVFLPYILTVIFRHQTWLNAKVAEEITERPTGD
jgi:hypothetical protein